MPPQPIEKPSVEPPVEVPKEMVKQEVVPPEVVPKPTPKIELYEPVVEPVLIEPEPFKLERITVVPDYAPPPEPEPEPVKIIGKDRPTRVGPHPIPEQKYRPPKGKQGEVWLTRTNGSPNQKGKKFKLEQGTRRSKSVGIRQSAPQQPKHTL